MGEQHAVLGAVYMAQDASASEKALQHLEFFGNNIKYKRLYA
jgi:hypothetical protein